VFVGVHVALHVHGVSVSCCLCAWECGRTHLGRLNCEHATAQLGGRSAGIAELFDCVIFVLDLMREESAPCSGEGVRSSRPVTKSALVSPCSAAPVAGRP